MVRRPPEGAPPDLAPLLSELDLALALLTAEDADRHAGVLREAAASVHSVAVTLRGPLGSGALIADPVAAGAFAHRASELSGRLVLIEARLDSAAGDVAADADDIEARNAALIACKDAVWALEWDRLATARAIEDLAGRGPLGRGALAGYYSIQVALSALDRLEVRGRDSAGLHVLVAGHGLDLGDPDVARLLAARASDALFASGSVRVADGNLAFVYKTAAEIGELGDNTARIRAAICADDLLRLALRSESARTSVLSHTRWASVGIISEPNAHPLNQEELAAPDGTASAGPYVAAALNGDVDNYADLKALESLRLPPEITTDAKVIPALVSRRMARKSPSGEAVPSDEAFRSTVASFEGSVAIGALTGAEPDQILLALRGSGQALYVGLGDECFVVASEPYGVVEECDRYMRLDGETMLEAGNPASQGQVVVLDARRAGSIDGIARQSYDGRAIPLREDELQTPEITTRDVARGDAAHYLLKEMAEAPDSFRKTLRGRIVERDGRLDVRLPSETLTPPVLGRLQDGSIRRVLVIGQGSAHVAGTSLARVLREALDTRPVVIEALTATELSGFGLTDDMHDTIVVAISQSGTTTDTNRTVDLARERGAAVVAIVNRRQSDLVDKSDGVLYTSDGRDVEMSVASTKAFYAQLAAGVLLAVRLAAELGADDVADRSRRSELLTALRELPPAMREVFSRRPQIALAAQRYPLQRRSWAVVGNGVNRTAALELRIKLSELCYKSIACDITEDKKHIDLSSEPMIIVCAAGLHGSNADDVAKEVAIYRAHKAAPIVIADDGETRFESAAAEMIPVPSVHPSLSFVLCALAGHLFGYEAALAIDASSRPLREARACIEALVGTVAAELDPLASLIPDVEPLAARFVAGMREGNYDGSLEARTAVQLASMLRYASGVVGLDAYHAEFGKVGTPSVVVEDLTAALTKAIEELTRPVDAIKHQAKTVTVGISRSDETLLQVRLVREVLATGAARDSLTYAALRTLVALDGAVDSVTGWTRYRIDGDPARGPATVHVVDRGGIARDIPSRTDGNPDLKGTKHRVAYEHLVTVGRGRSDNRTLIFVPEVKGAQTTGITLLHVRFLDRLAADAARRVLEGYRDRYQAIADQVTEVEPVMRDEVLGRIDLVDLLTEPVVRLADYWKQ